MSLDLRSLVPMIHVKSVPVSIEFYQKLGFELQNSFKPEGAPEPTWALLERNHALMMVTKASAAIAPEEQAVLFYLYYGDVKKAHADLTAAGLSPGSIGYPFYCPEGEFRLLDPDGYCLMMTHV